MNVMPSLTGKQICSMMRSGRTTIRGIAASFNLTMARVRYVRAHGVKGEAFVRDWQEITARIACPKPHYCPFCGGYSGLHDPGCGLKISPRIFACKTCRDSGEIDVRTTNHLGNDYTETIACPDCSFPKDEGYGVPSV